MGLSPVRTEIKIISLSRTGTHPDLFDKKNKLKAKRADTEPASLTREQREDAAIMLEQMKAESPAVSLLITSMGLGAEDY